MFNWLKKKRKFDIENPKFVAFDSQSGLNGFKKYANDNNTCQISSSDNLINVIISASNAYEAFLLCKIAVEALLLYEYNNNINMNLNKFINSNLWKISIYTRI